jgi:hypothetical protein
LELKSSEINDENSAQKTAEERNDNSLSFFPTNPLKILPFKFFVKDASILEVSYLQFLYF